MNWPDWLVEILKQFPGLVLGLGVGLYVVRLLSRLYEKQLERQQASHDKHLATKDEVIARLQSEIEALKKERDKWVKEAMGRGKT